MTRIVFIAILLAFSSAAAVNHASAQRAQCESQATNCLGRCASIDTRTREGQQRYNSCVPQCDRERSNCLLFSTRK
jgi:hypothetical protein